MPLCPVNERAKSSLTTIFLCHLPALSIVVSYLPTLPAWSLLLVRFLSLITRSAPYRALFLYHVYFQYKSLPISAFLPTVYDLSSFISIALLSSFSITWYPTCSCPMTQYFTASPGWSPVSSFAVRTRCALHSHGDVFFEAVLADLFQASPVSPWQSMTTG